MLQLPTGAADSPCEEDVAGLDVQVGDALAVQVRQAARHIQGNVLAAPSICMLSHESRPTVLTALARP